MQWWRFCGEQAAVRRSLRSRTCVVHWQQRGLRGGRRTRAYVWFDIHLAPTSCGELCGAEEYLQLGSAGVGGCEGWGTACGVWYCGRRGYRGALAALRTAPGRAHGPSGDRSQSGCVGVRRSGAALARERGVPVGSREDMGRAVAQRRVSATCPIAGGEANLRRCVEGLRAADLKARGRMGCGQYPSASWGDGK